MGLYQGYQTGQGGRGAGKQKRMWIEQDEVSRHHDTTGWKWQLPLKRRRLPRGTSPPQGLPHKANFVYFSVFFSLFLCFSLLATVYEIGANNTLYNWTSSTQEAGTSCRKKPMSKRSRKLFSPISKFKKKKNPKNKKTYIWNTLLDTITDRRLKPSISWKAWSIYCPWCTMRGEKKEKSCKLRTS